MATLEELCALSNKGEGHFGPCVAYAVATRTEAALIFFVVSATLTLCVKAHAPVCTAFPNGQAIFKICIGAYPTW